MRKNEEGEGLTNFKVDVQCTSRHSQTSEESFMFFNNAPLKDIFMFYFYFPFLFFFSFSGKERNIFVYIYEEKEKNKERLGCFKKDRQITSHQHAKYSSFAGAPDAIIRHHHHHHHVSTGIYVCIRLRVGRRTKEPHTDKNIGIITANRSPSLLSLIRTLW